MAQKGQRVDFSNGPDNLVKEGLRYNIPSPVKQIGPTCWYATTFNMLNYYGLHDDFAEYQKPPTGVTTDDWDFLRNFSAKEPLDRETKIMNMVVANKRTNFTLHSLDVANFTKEVARDKIITLLKSGPVYISMNEHPSARNTNMWDGTAIGHLAPGDHDVVYRTTNSDDMGGTPHAMLLVGYMRRDYKKLYEKATSETDGDKPYKIFKGITSDQDSKTMELILIDPNWPSHSGNKNNVILVDWSDIYGTKQNIWRLMYITENDN